ncbi:MAG: choice-of-anchor D domain-containing protein, partial [Cyclobacteriaceae bacterium]
MKFFTAYLSSIKQVLAFILVTISWYSSGQTSLNQALTEINARYTEITSLIPNPHTIQDSPGPTYSGVDFISDGGADMYDNGNYINTNISRGVGYADNAIDYSDNLLVANSNFGPTGEYWTRHFNQLFIMGAKLDNVSTFYIEGDLGSDGGGLQESYQINRSINGENYRGFVWQIYNATDPSVNHLVIVKDAGSTAFASDNGSTAGYDHTINSLTGNSEIYFLLYAQTGGVRITQAQHEAIMDKFLEILPSNTSLQFNDPTDYVDISTLNGPASGAPFTIEAWVKPNSSALEWKTIFEFGNDAPYFGLQDGLNFTISGSPSSHAIPIDTWTHVAAAFDGTVLKLFVNGIEQSSNTYTPSNSGVSAGIGWHEGDNAFSGWIDEVRYWSVSRSESQIAAFMDEEIAGGTPGLVAYYPMNEGTGTQLMDESNNSYTGTFSGTPIWSTDAPALASESPLDATSPTVTITSGETSPTSATPFQITIAFSEEVVGFELSDIVVGNGIATNLQTSDNTVFTADITGALETAVTVDIASIIATDLTGNGNVGANQFSIDYELPNYALNFDGVSDFVDLGDNFEAFDELTFESWVYYTETGSVYNEIFTKQFVNSFGIDPSHKIWFHVGDGSNWTGSGVASTSEIPRNVWTHLAVTWEGNTAKMYINGVLNTTAAHVATMGSNALSRGIGNYGNTNSNPFEGSIDELRIWDRARTDSEILADYNRSLNGDETGLVGYYNFDEGTGTSLTDLATTYEDQQNGSLTATMTGPDDEWVVSTQSFNDAPAPYIEIRYPNGGETFTANSKQTITFSTSGINQELVVEYSSDGGSNWSIITDGQPSALNGEVVWTIPQSVSYSANYQIRVSTNDGGSISGTSSTFTVVAPPENSLAFDGTNDDVRLGTIQASDPLALAGSNFTLEAWINPALTGDTYQRIISKSDDDNGANGYDLALWKSGRLELYLNGASRANTSGGEIVADTWQHVALVADGAAYTFYINGNPVSTTTSNYQNPPSVATEMIFGSWSNTETGRQFRGQIDDIRIWETDRSATEIKQNINTEITSHNDLVGAWNFNSAEGTTLYDISQSGYDGTLSGFDFNATTSDWVTSTVPVLDVANPIANITSLESGSTSASSFQITIQFNEDVSGLEISDFEVTNASVSNISGSGDFYNADVTPQLGGELTVGIASGTVTDLSGNPNDLGNPFSIDFIAPENALDFDKVDDAVSIAHDASLNFSSTMTIEAWVYLDALDGSWQSVVSKYNTSGNNTNEYVLSVNTNNKFQFRIAQSNLSDAQVVSTSDALAGQWVHLAGVADGANLKLYVNGEEVASNGYDGSINTNSRTLTIGKLRTEDAFGILGGQIDNVRIWNVARDKSQIIGNMIEEITTDNGLVSSYYFNQVGSTLYDATSNNDGSLINFNFSGTTSDWLTSTVPSCAPLGQFIGSVDADWNDPSNWCGGVVPTANNVIENVVVTNNSNIQETQDLVLNANVLQVSQGASLDLDLGSNNVEITNNATFTNEGTVNLTNGTTINATSGTFTNKGVVNVQNGTGVNASSGSFVNQGTFFFEQGAVLAAPSGTFVNEGVLKGFATVSNNFENPSLGTVSPGASPGCMDFVADFTNSGLLEVEIDGITACTEYDQITVGGTAFLGGTLTVIPGYNPTNGDEFLIIDATAVSGTFGTVNLPDGNWSLAYDSPSAGQVTISYFDPTQSPGLTGPGGVGETNGTSALQLWVKADAGTNTTTDGDAITSWIDQSGYGHSFANATSPAYQSNVLNGQPVIRFDHGESMQATGFTDNFTSTGFTIFTIAKWDAPGGDQGFLGFKSQTGLGSNQGVTFFVDDLNGTSTTLRVSSPSSGSLGGSTWSSTTTDPHLLSFTRSTSLLNAYDGGTNVVNDVNEGAIYDGTDPWIIGNYYNSNNKFFDGDVAEFILYEGVLTTAPRIIVENYLSAKYDITTSTDYYAGDTNGNGDFDFDVIGIGQEVDGYDPGGAAGGVILTDNGFLLDNGDYMFAGHDGTAHDFVQTDLPSGYTNRWARSWYVDVTDVSTNGGEATVGFDFDEAGLTYDPSANYALAYRATNTGDFTLFSSVSVVDGNVVSFTGNALGITDGYYTIVDDRVLNYSLSFDGVDDHVLIPDDNALDLTTSYTLETWVKINSFSQSGGLISKYATPSANGYLLRLSGSGNFQGLNFDELETADNLLSAGTWYHVAAVNDNGTRKLYLDGAEVALSGSALTVTANTDPLTIGVDYLTGDPRYLDAEMDEVRIWNIARSATEIANNYDRVVDPNSLGLVVYHNFAQDLFTETAIEASGNGNNGALNPTGMTAIWSASGPDLNEILPNPPVITDLRITNIADKSFNLNLTTDNNVTLYTIVTQDPGTPSVSQIVAGNDATGGSAENNTAISVSVGAVNVGIGQLNHTPNDAELAVSTTYYIHVVADGGSGNYSQVLTESFNTLSGNPLNTEGFESLMLQAYNGTTTLPSGDWEFSNAFGEDGTVSNGSVSLGIDATAPGNFYSPGIDGSGEISFYYATNSTAEFTISESINGGSFSPIATITATNTDFKQYTRSLGHPGSTVQIYISTDDIASTGNLYIDDFGFTGLPQPEVTFITLPVTGSTLTPDQTDVVFYKLQMDVSSAASVTTQGFYLELENGPYAPADFAANGFDIYASVGTDQLGTLVGTANSFGDVVANSFGMLFTETYNPNDKVYFYFTVDVSSAPTDGNTFSVKQPIADNFGLDGSVIKNDGGLTGGGAFIFSAPGGSSLVTGSATVTSTNGFDFSRQELLGKEDAGDYQPDFVYVNNEGVNFGNEGSTSLASTGNRILLLGTGTLDAISSVSDFTGSAPWINVSYDFSNGTLGSPISVGQLWAMYSREGNYAVMEITAVGGSDFSFNYKYQPNGTNSFEDGLSAPTAFEASEASSVGFRANWEIISGASKLFVDIDDNEDFGSPFATNIEVTDPTADSDFILQDLSTYLNQDLFYRLSYTDGVDTSAYSDAVSFRVTPGNALPFAGDDYVIVPDDILLEPAGDFTIEFWYNSSAIGNNIILEKGNANAEFSVQQSTGNLIILNVNNGIVSTNNMYNDGNWHHIAIVYRGSSNATIYVDGVDDTSANGVGTPSYGSGALTIGGRLGSPGNVIDGSLDEVRIWDDERTLQEIENYQYSTLTGNEEGLLAYYRFDETNSTVLPDLSGNDLNGTLTNMTGTEWVSSGALSSGVAPTAPADLIAYKSSDTEIQLEWTDVANDNDNYLIEWSATDDFAAIVGSEVVSGNTDNQLVTIGSNAGYFFRVTSRNVTGNGVSETEFATTKGFSAHALSFDGTDDYVDLGNPADLEILGDLTLSAWVYWESNGADQHVITRSETGETENTNISYILRVDASGSVYYIHEYGAGQNASVTSTATITPNTWNHIAISRTVAGTTQLEIYINGVKDVTEGINLTNPSGGTSATVKTFIGGNNQDAPNDATFKGQIDDVRIYNIAKTDFSDRFTPLQGNETGLVAYYAFDENTNGTGTKVIDNSINANHGDLIGGTMWSTTGAIVPAFTPYSLYPSDGSTGVPADATFSIGFGETVTSTADYLYFTDVSDGTAVDSLKINSDVTILNDSAVFSPLRPHNFIVGRTYAITFENGTFEDDMSSPLDGIVDTTLWNFEVVAQSEPRYFVSNTNDAGGGSLRQAILEANVSEEAIVAINFNLPGDGTSDTWRITPATSLPTIYNSNNPEVIIDASSQPGWDFAGDKLIHLEGGDSINNGFYLDAYDIEVYGFKISGFNLGINGGYADNAVIGAPAKGNVIISNDVGVFFEYAANVVIQDNHIGVDYSGDVAMSNRIGVDLGYETYGEPSMDTVRNNVISGNTEFGLGLSYYDNVIYGNTIGLNAGGNAAVPNDIGIVVGGYQFDIYDNIISANDSVGILIDGFNSSNHHIRGNTIGTDASNLLPLGNGYGILGSDYDATNPSDTTLIGGYDLGHGNVIAFNANSAISLSGDSYQRVKVLTNSIFGNGKSLELLNGADSAGYTPTITTVSTGMLSGDFLGYDGPYHVQVFESDMANRYQGKVFVGETIGSGSSWSISGSFDDTKTHSVSLTTDLNGTSEFGTSDVENALTFNGTNQYVEVPNNAALNEYTNSGELTIEFWVNRESNTSGHILSNRPGANNAGFIIIFSGANATFYIHDGAWRNHTVALPNANEWHHIAMVAVEGVDLKIYFDGDLAGSVAVPGSFTQSASVMRMMANTSALNNYAEGQLDEVRIWSTARTRQQLADSAYVTLSSGPGLQASYSFNHTSGDVIDLVNGNNGALINGPTYVPSAAFDLDVFRPILSNFVQNDVTSEALDFNIEVDELSTLHYVATKSNTPPTEAQVLAGQDELGTSVAISGSYPMVNGSINQILNGFIPATTYYLYYVAEDGASNLSTVLSATITTESAPNVTITSTEAGATVLTPFPITITFDEEVVGFTVSDITVTNGTISNLNTSDNISFTASVTPVADGRVTVTVASDVAQDLDGNDNNGSQLFSIFSCTINDESVLAGDVLLRQNDSTTISLSNSVVGVNYYLRDDSDNSVVTGPVVGTGSGIAFNTSGIEGSTTYNVFAGSDGTPVYAPQIQPTPFGLANHGTYNGVNFGDLDNDGDLDIMSSSRASSDYFYYENIGTATSPNYTTAVVNPFNLAASTTDRLSDFVDLDNDGDLDLMSSEVGGKYYYHENIGTATTPEFAAEVTNPFGLVANGNAYSWGMELKDIDGDGDMDLFTSNNGSNTIHYFENVGTATSPVFGSRQTNPFGIAGTSSSYNLASLEDFDSDGDFDLLVGGSNGNWYYRENTGTASAPSFGAVQFNPFGLAKITNTYAVHGVADLDLDGDLDILSGSNIGEWSYFENQAGPACSLEMTQTVTVTIDAVAPTFTNLSSADNTETTLDINYTIDEVSDLYYIVVSNSDATPAVNSVLDGGMSYAGPGTVHAVGSVAAVTTGSLTATGLSSGTAYDLYFVAQDVVGNNSALSSVLNFSTVAGNPEIEIQGQGIEIVSGDVTPANEDDTDFGSMEVGGTSITKTYTINNTGTADLNLGVDAVSASGDTDFTVGLQPDIVVTAGGSTTFTIVFDAVAEGVRSSQVLVFSDDADENPYTFNIEGTGTPAADITAPS